MNQPPKILFLYTELAGYFLSCVAALQKKYQAEVYIVRFPVNKEAPFKFDFTNLTVYERNDYTNEQLLELVKQINPTLIFCSGWIDKGYLKVCKEFKQKGISTVLTFDNQWTGHWKQKIASLVSPVYLKRIFTHCWVSGERQKQFAEKLHFSEAQISTGMYSADVPKFEAIYSQNRQSKKENFPHIFTYVGRYYEFKGIKDLWASFEELKAETESNWELWCLGTGDLDSEFPKHPNIKNFGFVQPDNLETIISKSGVFVLPSYYEPWGVVVHEYATAGFPLICSNAVGANTSFLEPNKNGFVFTTKSKLGLKKCMKEMMDKTDEELFEMGEHSNQLSKNITPEKWADTLISMIS